MMVSISMESSIILFVFFELKTRREERQLSLVFAGYSAYQQRVKKLLPYISLLRNLLLTPYPTKTLHLLLTHLVPSPYPLPLKDFLLTLHLI